MEFAGAFLEGGCRLGTGLAAGLGATLGDAFGAAFFTTGLPLLTALEGAALTVDGFVAFLAGAITFAFDLLDGLIFFAAVFELVLRGFFTSCLLAVAAYAPNRAPAICK
jgi:hypothetical protein